MGSWDVTEGPDDGTGDSRESSPRQFADGTPEDVAALYTWANLQGAPYRDFSASRRRYRELVRNQAAERQTGLSEVPVYTEALTREDARPSDLTLEEPRRVGSAIRWANRRGWESSSRSTEEAQLARRKPEISTEVADSARTKATGRVDAEESGAPRKRDTYDAAEANATIAVEDSSPERGFAGLSDDRLYRSRPMQANEDRWERIDSHRGEMQESFASKMHVPEPEEWRGSEPVRTWEPHSALEPEFDGPAWLFAKSHEPVRSPFEVGADAEAPMLKTTPRPAAVHRWSALREAVDGEWIVPRGTRASTPAVRRAPLLVVFSIAGGVGKTSLVATVGRALSSSGERVLLGDAAPYSLLPFFFGGNELRPGEMRRFAPSENSGDSPILLVNYDLARAANDLHEQKHVVGEILRWGAECHRILLDMPMGSEWLLRRLATLQAAVLVPLLPDLGSVVSVEALERYFARFADEDGDPVLPFYVLSQFDASQKLHLDVRDLLRGRLGERLLSFAVRRSTAVSEALAEGMTVADYSPESAVARDYFDVAVWLRTVSPPVLASTSAARSGRG